MNKKTSLLYLLFLLINTQTQAQWYSLGSPERGNCIKLDADANRLYAAVTGGVLYTDDTCNTWQPLPAPIDLLYPSNFWAENGRLFMVSRYAQNDEYAAARLFQSEDQGQQWHDITPFMFWQGAEKTLAIEGDTIVMAVYDSLALSFDGGNHFTLSEYYPPVYFERLFLKNGVLYAAGEHELYRSTDLGQNWESVLNTAGFAWYMYQINNVLWCVIGTTPHGLLYKSTDQGLHWENIPLPNIGSGAPGLTGGDGKLFLLDNIVGDVYFSENNGGAWVKKISSFYPNQLYYFAGKVASNGGSGIRVSSNNGTSFPVSKKGFAQAEISQTLAAGNRVWAAVGSSLFIQESGQSDWKLSSFLKVAGGSDAHLIAGKTDSLFRSEDGGDHWIHVSNMDLGYAWNPSFNRIYRLNNVFYMIGLNIAKYSTDFGISWNTLNFDQPDFGSPYYFSYANGHYITADAVGHILYGTDGIHWSDISLNLQGSSVRLVQASAHRLFAFNDAGLWTMEPTGNQWIPANAPVPNPDFPADYIPKITTMLWSGGRLFAGVYGHGLFVSNNEGDSWQQWDENLSDHQILCAYTEGNAIWLGTDGGIWRTDFFLGTHQVAAEKNNHIQVFPQPATTKIQVQFDTPFTGSLRVFDAMGRLVLTQSDLTEILSYKIAVNVLPIGIYHFIAIDSTGKQSKAQFEVLRP